MCLKRLREYNLGTNIRRIYMEFDGVNSSKIIGKILYYRNLEMKVFDDLIVTNYQSSNVSFRFTNIVRIKDKSNSQSRSTFNFEE